MKPVTKRLDTGLKLTPNENVKESAPQALDYGMDEFDRTNPSRAEFQPDAETPAPTPPQSNLDETDEDENAEND